MDVLESEYEGIAKALSAESSPVVQAASIRKLTRCTQRLDLIHELGCDYASDVSRRDLPVGLLCLIDVLLEDYGLTDADPIIHLDSTPMYSTLPLSSSWRETIRAPMAEVVVFNLPALDPANMLLSPLLAHEAGHILIERDASVDSVLDHPDGKRVIEQLQSTIEQHLDVYDPNLLTRLQAWVSELLCDALAARLTGPSFLYAAASFLPAPAPLVGETHPPSAYRTKRMLEELESLGWTVLISGDAELHQWLQEFTKASAHEGQSATTRLLLDAVTKLDSTIRTISATYPVMDSAAYFRDRDKVKQEIVSEVPSVDGQVGVLSLWQLLLAAWEVAFEGRGMSVAALSEAVGDHNFSMFISKNMELIRITELWRRS